MGDRLGIAGKTSTSRSDDAATEADDPRPQTDDAAIESQPDDAVLPSQTDDAATTTDGANATKGDGGPPKKRKVAPKEDYEKRRERKYLPEWQLGYPWLYHENSKMFCKVCIDCPKSRDYNAFVSGTDSFRLQTIKSHAKSEKHVLAENVARVRENPERAPMNVAMRHMTAGVREKLRKLFRTAYYIGKRQLPFSHFAPLCQLQELNGVTLGETYINDHPCKNFLSIIDKCLKEDLAEELNSANAVSVMPDGSCDSGVIEEEIVFVKYLCGGVPVTDFLSLQPVPNATGAGVKSAVEAAFEDVGVEKVASAGTDGASVNTGNKNGLVALMKEDGMPWLIGIWCVAHLFERGLLDAIKEEAGLGEIKDLLQGMYKHYHYSAKAFRELREVAVALEDKVLKPVNLLGTRWAPHMYRALKVLIGVNFRPLYTHFDHTAQSNTASATMVGRARKIINQLGSMKLLLLMHLMLDILEAANDLSLHFQRDKCTLSSASDALATFAINIEALRHGHQGNLHEFILDVGGPGADRQRQWRDVHLTIVGSVDAALHEKKRRYTESSS
ncbi:zinc finger protein 862-like isoform 1-T1 [Syngnathus typhle]